MKELDAGSAEPDAGAVQAGFHTMKQSLEGCKWAGCNLHQMRRAAFDSAKPQRKPGQQGCG